VTDSVAEFRQSRVYELDELVNACREERLDPGAEAANIVARLRELYFFSPDMRSLVQHVAELATKYSIADWAANGQSLTEQPWSRIKESLERVLTEPPLYQRDWSVNPIEPLFQGAIAGWIDLADCARRVKAASVSERIDDLKLLTGAMTVFQQGCQGYFSVLKTSGSEHLESIFITIFRRGDVSMDMFPSALTYFGSEGLEVLNRVSTEVDELCQALQGYADRQVFDIES
jgi:hypothetical protein